MPSRLLASGSSADARKACSARSILPSRRYALPRFVCAAGPFACRSISTPRVRSPAWINSAELVDGRRESGTDAQRFLAPAHRFAEVARLTIGFGEFQVELRLPGLPLLNGLTQT